MIPKRMSCFTIPLNGQGVTFRYPILLEKGAVFLEYLQKSPEDAKPQNVILCSMGMGYNP